MLPIALLLFPTGFSPTAPPHVYRTTPRVISSVTLRSKEIETALRLPRRSSQGADDPPTADMRKANAFSGILFAAGFLAVSAVARSDGADPLVLPFLLALLFVMPAALIRLLPSSFFSLPASRTGEEEPDFRMPWDRDR